MKREILVYLDEGVAPGCASETPRSLRLFGEPHGLSVRAVSAQDIIDQDWEQGAALLAVPGGRASPYGKKLGVEGCQRIVEYVCNGGRYLGLCAGAYFAAQEIEFARGQPYEILTQGGCVFFRGSAIGPVLAPDRFEYNSEMNAGVVGVIPQCGETPPLAVYYNGGCYFSAEDWTGVDIVATYPDPQSSKPAIIALAHGAGRVLLAGVHVEYSYRSLDSCSPIYEKLRANEGPRQSYFDKLLETLVFS